MATNQKMVAMLVLDTMGFKDKLSAAKNDLDNFRKNTAKPTTIAEKADFQNKFGMSYEEREAQLAKSLTDVKAAKNAAWVDASKKMGDAAQKAQFAMSGLTRGILVAGAAIKSADILTDAWNGRWDEAADKLKKLPLGIGSVVQALEELTLKATGWGDEIARNNAIAEGLNKIYDNHLSIIKDIRTYQKDSADARMKAIEDERIALERVDEVRKGMEIESKRKSGIEGANEKQKAELDKIDKAIKEQEASRKAMEEKLIKAKADMASPAGDMYGDRLIREKSQKQINELAGPMEEARRSIENLEKQKKKIIDEGNKDRAVVEDQANARKLRQQEDYANKLASLESERIQAAARLAGDGQRAEMESLKERYRQRAETATEAERQIMAETFAIEAEGIKKKYDAKDAAAQAQKDKEIAAIDERMKKSQERASKLIDDMIAKADQWDAESVKAGESMQIVRAYTAFGQSGAPKKEPIIGDPKQTEYLSSIANTLKTKGVVARAA